MKKVFAISGSLRKESINSKILNIAANAARAKGVDVQLVDLASLNLPLYDGDYEAAHGLPENLKELKKEFNSGGGYIIASPEYNSTYSGALKNFIDWVSRPVEGEGSLAAFNGKAAAILSASPGALGGIRGLINLRALLSAIRLHVLPEQHALGKVNADSFDEAGNLKNAKDQKTIQGIGEAIAKFIS